MSTDVVTKEAVVVRKEAEEDEEKDDGEHNVSSPDPYYPPIIYLPEVIVNSGQGFLAVLQIYVEEKSNTNHCSKSWLNMTNFTPYFHMKIY